MVATPVQYIRLISFTPSANQPGELYRISVLVIEIGSYLANHNSSYFKLQKSHKEDFIKIHSLKTPSSLSGAKFLTGFAKKQGLHLHCIAVGHGFCKKYPLRFRCFCGINRCAIYSTVNEIFFAKTLLLPNPVSRPGCYDQNERGECRVQNIFKQLNFINHGNDSKINR